MTLIELKNVSKTFPLGTTHVTALSGVDLRVNAGDFLAVTGPSGSDFLHVPSGTAFSGTWIVRSVRIACAGSGNASGGSAFTRSARGNGCTRSPPGSIGASSSLT